MAVLVGVPLGVWAAVRQGGWVDMVIRVVCLSGHSLPVFVLALLALLVFYATLQWAPGPGRQGIMFDGMVDQRTGLLLVDAALAGRVGRAFRDALRQMALPALVLGLSNMAYIARMTRGFMLDALRGEWVITARAKGLSAASVVWRHAFGNILVRLVTVLALTYAGLLEGAVLTETIFLLARPGAVPDRQPAERRHERRAGGDAGSGADLCGAEPAGGPDAYRVLDPRMR